MNREKLSRLEDSFGALCELKGKEPSVMFLKMYRKALLAELTIDEAIAAIEMAFARKTFGFPSPGDLIEWIKGGSEDASLLAWELVQLAFSRVGASGSVLFVDSKISRTIELLGGWVKLCLQEGEDAEWSRREFSKIYRTLPSSGQPKVLYGTDEISNRAKGYLPIRDGEPSTKIHCIPPPTVIGHPQKLLQGNGKEMPRISETMTDAIDMILPNLTLPANGNGHEERANSGS